MPRKFWTARHFYSDETFEPIWKEFTEICKRENESASEKIRDMIMRYVSVHANGNPQWLLERFMDKLPTTECFFCHGHFPHLKKVRYRSGLVAPTCEVCLGESKIKACVVRVLA